MKTNKTAAVGQPETMIFETIRRRVVRQGKTQNLSGLRCWERSPEGSSNTGIVNAPNDRTGFLFRNAKSKSLLENTLKTIMSVTSNVSSDAEVISTCSQNITLKAKNTINVDGTVSNTCENQAKAVATLKALSKPKVQQELKNQLTSMAKSQIKGLPTSLMSSTSSDSTVRNYVEQVSQITSNSYTRCASKARTYQNIDLEAKDINIEKGISNNASLNAVLNCMGSAVGETQAFQQMDNAVKSTATAIDSGFNPLSWLGALLAPELLAMIVPVVSSCCMMLCCCMMLLFLSSSGGGGGGGPIINQNELKAAAAAAASQIMQKAKA